MLIFRLICAVMVAWALNWVIARPEAVELVDVAPQMTLIAPIAGAIVGFFNLAKRQGWGFIVSIANGLWTGILTILAAGVIFLSYRMFGFVSHNLIKDFEGFLRVLGYEAGPVVKAAANTQLLAITVAATAVTGVVSEFLHWSLVRLRRYREGDEGEELT